MEFVNFEIAKELKEKGFDGPCEMYYHIHDDIADCVGSLESTGGEPNFLNSNNKYRCAAPTISHVLKWLREEKKVFVVIAVNPTLATKNKMAYYYNVYFNSDGVTSDYYESEEGYAQWEDCAMDSIKFVLKYLI